MPKRRYFKMNCKVDEMIINAITGTDAKDKIININQKANKEVQRCLDLTNPVNSAVGGNPSIQLAGNPPTSKRESLHIVGGKTSVNKNREKEQNIKTEQKQIVCLSAPEIKDKEYLVDELSDKLNISKAIISNKIEKAVNDTKYSYSDLKLAYEFKKETIDWLLNGKASNYDDNKKANTVISSIKKGVPDTLKQQEEEEAQYEEMNNRSFNSLLEDKKLISLEEENISISFEDKKQLECLRDIYVIPANVEGYIELFKRNQRAQAVYMEVLKPFEKGNVLISGFTKADMTKFNLAYEALQKLPA